MHAETISFGCRCVRLFQWEWDDFGMMCVCVCVCLWIKMWNLEVTFFPFDLNASPVNRVTAEQKIHQVVSVPLYIWIRSQRWTTASEWVRKRTSEAAVERALLRDLIVHCCASPLRKLHTENVDFDKEQTVYALIKYSAFKIWHSIQTVRFFFVYVSVAVAADVVVLIFSV